MKKGEAAQAAEKLLQGKDWLPEFMAAAQVAEVRFYGDDDDDADDECDDVTLDAGECDDSAASEGPQHADAAPWPFPKAADFEPFRQK